jgi:type I restriction enzyme M protein
MSDHQLNLADFHAVRESAMEQSQHNAIVSFIWRIADDVLRDYISRSKYRDIILPMTVIRRLDSLLEPTKDAVIRTKQRLDHEHIVNQYAALCQASGQAFYNISPFTLEQLLDTPKQLKANFEDYLDGFSQNAQEILDKFKFRNQIPTLVEADILYQVIEKFLDPSVNLSPEPICVDGEIKQPGLDNHGMGTIFEELIRRFNEENNEEAGEHFTPRDVVRLMANLIFLPIADRVESGTYLVYDGACGTGGMLTIAEERLIDLARRHGKQVAIHLFGQETNAETYAISKADLLLKGEGEEAENIRYGSTLSADAFPSHEFDFMLSNPPYGKSWKTDLERMGGKGDIQDPRFIVKHRGDPDFRLVTRSSDGQMMFLVNMLDKMKSDTPLGSRIAEIHSGSSLFTGDAGQGESNIRRWIIENDWLEAIVALPENMFYNTGIPTYIWVLNNRKPSHRTGLVQLINAVEWYRPLRKNLGKKNCELAEAHIKRICDSYLAFEDNEDSKIFRNEAFGYWKITVERPLRFCVTLTDEIRRNFRQICEHANEKPLADFIDQVASQLGWGPHRDFNKFLESVDAYAKGCNFKLDAQRRKLLKSELAFRNDAGRPIIHKRTRAQTAISSRQEALYGRYLMEAAGTPWMVEYEPDPELRDTEKVPLLENGGIEAFFTREVLPFAPDSWISATTRDMVGYEISFTRCFYKPKQIRSLDDIKAEIHTLDEEMAGILKEITGEE